VAHIGKDYELHFRRDLGTQIANNRNSFAKRYDVGAAFLGGSVGNALVNDLFRCNAFNEHTFNGATWQSNFFPAGGRLVRYVLECSLNSGFKETMLRVTVEDQIVGNLIVVDAIRNKNAGYATIEANDIVVPATHPLLLSTDGPNALFQAFAVRWGA
jgi:hypothetical protein